MKRRKSSRDTKDYKVGYGKPPLRTRFAKGVSGNPSGRPRGVRPGRVKELMVKEFFRTLRIKEGDKITELPAFAAIMRSFVAAAVKGNGPAQRAAIEMIRMLEREIADSTVLEMDARLEADKPSELEVARRIAFTLERAGRKLEQQRRNGTVGGNSI